MREYTDEEYEDLVEDSPEPGLEEQMVAESDMIHQVHQPAEKAFIDLGAGHGRVLPQAADLAKRVISIELNPDMLPELRRRAGEHENAEVVEGDMTKLTSLLGKDGIENPVLLLLQNTLGTVEGDENALLEEMNSFASGRGEIIISLFRAEALPEWGVNDLYPSVQEMVGRPDIEATSFEHGVFRSQTGYESKWWFEDEIEEIIDGFNGVVENERWADHYYVGHVSLR